MNRKLKPNCKTQIFATQVSSVSCRDHTKGVDSNTIEPKTFRYRQETVAVLITGACTAMNRSTCKRTCLAIRIQRE